MIPVDHPIGLNNLRIDITEWDFCTTRVRTVYKSSLFEFFVVENFTLSEMFVIFFRRQLGLQKYFYTENFQIYGIVHIGVLYLACSLMQMSFPTLPPSLPVQVRADFIRGNEIIGS